MKYTITRASGTFFIIASKLADVLQHLRNHYPAHVKAGSLAVTNVEEDNLNNGLEICERGVKIR